MDSHLKRLADISMALGAAEESLEENAPSNAREHADSVAEQLDELRTIWPSMSAAEQSIVGATAAPLRARLDAVRARLPKLAALGEIPLADRPAAEDDGPPDDELPPAA